MSGDDRQNSPSISRQNRPSATVSSEKGKISDINKNSFIYIAPKDERDDTIKIQLSDYENGISYEYTIPLIFAGNNEHSLDKFKENLSRLPNS